MEESIKHSHTVKIEKNSFDFNALAMEDDTNCPFMTIGSNNSGHQGRQKIEDCVLADLKDGYMGDVNNNYDLIVDFRLADKAILSGIRVDETVKTVKKYADIQDGYAASSNEMQDESYETTSTYLIDEGDFVISNDSMFSIATNSILPTYTYELTSHKYTVIGNTSYYGLLSTEEQITTRKYSFIGWKDDSQQCLSIDDSVSRIIGVCERDLHNIDENGHSISSDIHTGCDLLKTHIYLSCDYAKF